MTTRIQNPDGPAMTEAVVGEARSGRSWLISGVAGGLGRAIALRALGAGDSVIGTVRKTHQRSEFEALAPGRAVALEFDITDLDAIGDLVPRAIADAGGVDVLVNNAGYSLIGAVEDTSIAEARKIMETNFFGALHLTQTVLPHMRERGSGSILNVASVASTIGFPFAAMYSASKSALAALTESLAQEISGFGLSATCIEPGGIRTNFAGSGLAVVAKSGPGYRAPVDVVLGQYAEAAPKMRNDPTRVAEVVYTLAQMPDPPVRVAIGEDGHQMIAGALQRRIESYADMRDRTVGTDVG